MDFGHARRFATAQASQLAGDLYPGPVLMPHGYLRAMDPVLAVALGPAREGGEFFEFSFERCLRGRPDGPLLLALWSSAAGGEISHADLRAIVRLMPEPLPDFPERRGDLLAFLHPRVSAVARCMLAVIRRNQPEALAPAERLGIGLVLTRILIDLPDALARGEMPLPVADLERCGLSYDDLRQGVRNPAIDRFLSYEARWAREVLDRGLPLRTHVGARLRRGIRAAVVRARRLLDRVEDPTYDLFRKPPHLSARERWHCVARAMLGIRAESIAEEVERESA